DIDQLKLRILFSGSDKVNLRPPDRARFEYINAYGPTESTVIVTAGEVPHQDRLSAAPDIGRPLANALIHIVDRGLNEVPIGLQGELCIAGDPIARGYLGQAGLTAEKFIPNPFGACGLRMYRTGDLARFRADGKIEFVGRIDSQVKLRGFR